MSKAKTIKKTAKPAAKKAVVKPIAKKLAVKKTRASKNDGNRDYAFILYMKRVPQNDIAERCNVSIQTITDWKTKDNWEAKRASKNISMDTLIVKALEKINGMLDEEDFNADAFAKAVSQLKTLKQRNTVDDEVMCLMDFQNFLLDRRIKEGIDDDFIKRLTRLQDAFIQNRLCNLNSN
jgi:hypothetical protein